MPGDEALAEPVAVAIHFHLAADVRASLARDQRSVLLTGPSGTGWWLRNDAGEVALEPSAVFENGVARGSTPGRAPRPPARRSQADGCAGNWPKRRTPPGLITVVRTGPLIVFHDSSAVAALSAAAAPDRSSL